MTTPYEAALKVPQVGEQAPMFKLSAHPSGTISLSDFTGKKNVILAFYPKDDTPGCTKEMCAFSEDLSKFNDTNTQVLGISCDTVESHGTFAAKYNLKQTLLADPEGAAAKAYGALREGRSSANRVLFVIDKQGIVRYVHEGMPENDKLLEVIKNLK